MFRKKTADSEVSNLWFCFRLLIVSIFNSLKTLLRYLRFTFFFFLMYLTKLKCIHQFQIIVSISEVPFNVPEKKQLSVKGMISKVPRGEEKLSFEVNISEPWYWADVVIAVQYLLGGCTGPTKLITCWKWWPQNSEGNFVYPSHLLFQLYEPFAFRNKTLGFEMVQASGK